MNLIIYLQIKSGFYQETEIIKIAKIVKEVVLVKELTNFQIALMDIVMFMWQKSYYVHGKNHT